MLATVISASRRFIEILTSEKAIVSAIAESKAMDITAGDSVEYINENNQYIVIRVLERRNCLSRCYRNNEKKLAANLDLILIVCAMNPLFNTSFIDRILVASASEKIDATLIINKNDLDKKETKEYIEIYEKLNIPIIYTNTIQKDGIKDLLSALNSEEIKITALAGISGVGKTSILNLMVPNGLAKTRTVSSKTGQGRQTTSQSYAYTIERTGLKDLLLIDLPGLSNFGLTNLDKYSIKLYFQEFLRYQENCQYKDCLHLKEPNCAVKKAIEMKLISEIRYNNYIDILNEIDDSREY